MYITIGVLFYARISAGDRAQDVQWTSVMRGPEWNGERTSGSILRFTNTKKDLLQIGLFLYSVRVTGIEPARSPTRS